MTKRLKESDIRKAFQETLGLTAKAKKARSAAFAAVVFAEWRALASSELNTSKSAYLRSLVVHSVTSKGFIVGLPARKSTSVLALMVELGMGPSGIGSEGRYDMRKFMLKDSTSNIRRDKKGQLYLRVPFGHTKKGITASYGSHVANQISKLAPSFTTREGRTIWGGRFPEGKVAKLKAHHVTDPLAGMVRLASTYKNKKGKTITRTSGYRTWRTMSYNNRSPEAWMNKGIKARRYIDIIESRLPDLYNRTFGVSS